MTDLIDPNQPDIVRLTATLEQVASMFSAGGFLPELREPYKEYETEIAGRDLKISHADTPAYYAAVKSTASAGGIRLVAHSATYHRPGFARQVWPPGSDLSVAYTEIVQFIGKHYDEFRRDESAAKA